MYLSAQEFIDRFGEREAVQLTAEASSTAVNTARLTQGITDAEGMVNGYLARRFSVPLLDASTMQPIEPDLIKRLTGDIARYMLCGTSVRETEAIRNRYKDAIRDLDLIAMGKLSIGMEAALASSASAPPAGSTAVRAGARMFSDDVLGGY